MKLLAVDAGLHCGYAMFDLLSATLLWYRSHNYGQQARLRRGVATLVGQEMPIAVIVVEGGGAVAEPWLKVADFHRIPLIQIHAHQWRADILHAREQRSGADAKRATQQYAQISMGNAKVAYHYNQVRHDAAEAILIGEWAMQFNEMVHQLRSSNQREGAIHD